MEVVDLSLICRRLLAYVVEGVEEIDELDPTEQEIIGNQSTLEELKRSLQGPNSS